MASKVLKSFLIGIGYDTRALEVGDRKINASLQGIKSNALGISAALVGAFGAGAGLVANTASRIDRLASATQNMRTPMNTVYNFGNAVETMGGQASEALDALKRLKLFWNSSNLFRASSASDACPLIRLPGLVLTLALWRQPVAAMPWISQGNLKGSIRG